jgi:hypothetical protein
MSLPNSQSLRRKARLGNPSCLTATKVKNYNKRHAEVAQSVEQRTENPRVPSSILGLGTIH